MSGIAVYGIRLARLSEFSDDNRYLRFTGKIEFFALPINLTHQEFEQETIMKTYDLFLNAPQTVAIAAGLLMLFSVAVHADAPSPETFNKSSELVLTLSDHWSQSDKQAPFNAQSKRDTSNLVAGRAHKRPVKVDCGMDINQYPSIDNSLGSRLTGECDLHYNY